MEAIIYLDPRFPLDDVEAIGRSLAASGGLVAGYDPPQAGMLSVSGLPFGQEIEGLSTVVLPDRNLASRMARVARDGVQRPLDEPTQLAVNVMAFAQAMNMLIEPSIAFHELAHLEGNDAAHDELAWFRASDRGQADAWIDIAMGRADQLLIRKPAPKEIKDLAFPLRRWRRNYLVVLKIAELELSPMAPLERVKRLLDWMAQDFIVAGPAAIFSTMYLSPNAARHRMLKSLRSEDRENAIKGLRNAAWDITHLSDFVRRSVGPDAESTRNIFATADKNLARIASVLLVGSAADNMEAALTKSLKEWWPNDHAGPIAQRLSENASFASNRPPPRFEGESADPIGDWITAAEAWVLNWKAAPNAF